MKTISNKEHIYINLLVLEKYRRSPDKKEKDFYSDLIRNGHNFVVVSVDGEFIFGPSRFIGYVNNNRNSHMKNNDKFGTETDIAINKVLGQNKIDSYKDKIIYELCEGLSVKPKKYNNKPRRYWSIK